MGSGFKIVPDPKLSVSSLKLVLLAVMLTAASSSELHGQTTEDGIMLSKLKYCTGVFYTYDKWDHYWEGPLYRSNGNIGAITTRTISYIGNYGLTDHINLLITVPHVSTSASQGVLHGQSGWQDSSFAVKAKLASVPIGRMGALRAIAVVSGSIPMTKYTPDDAPLSLGTQSKQISGRGTLNYLRRNGVYLNGSSAYTWRGNVQLDRPSYYTNGQLYFSDEVAMPNVFDYSVGGGYRKNDTTLVVSYSQHQTRGGGDIRPQDAPFVSNRMNDSKIGGTITIPLPRVHDLQYWVILNHTLNGRNVGESNTITTGMLYTFDFRRNGSKR